ncbi:polysaccharide biosynthesis tyrosine autokinase [Luteimonas aquatica]|uniref:polysaccharide biosynthesis tyrosine autokinase n=1 Tax=Luteimonas aquatica TaxID=450364 RepID=UPI001F5744B8|nr:polysaccharide biosynthesis tyrosine autokinase [Luteimonas aquatica]
MSMRPLPTGKHDASEEIDLASLLGTLVDHKWLIAAVTAACFVLSVCYALLSAPVYQATAMIQVEPKTPTLPGLDDVSQILTESAPQAVTEIALLTSRSVIGEAVDELNLDVDVRARRFPLIGGFMARRAGNAGPAPAFLGMDSYGWGGEQLVIETLEVPGPLVGTPLRLQAGEAGSYRLYDEDDNLLAEGKVGGIVRSGAVTVQVTRLAANPGTEFDVVRQRRLATIAAVQGNISASENAKDSGIILLSYELRDPEMAATTLAAISKQYIRQNIERNSAEAANSLRFVKEQLPKVRGDLEKAEGELNAFQSKAHSVDISLETKAILDQIVGIDTTLSQLRMQQAEVERRYTAQHPAYRALMKQIGGLEAKRKALTDQAGDLPQTQQELLRLTRDVQVSTQTYTGLLNQEQQLDIARAGTVGNAHVIDPAVVDVTQPVRPNRLRIVVIGTFLGAFLVVAWVFLRQMLSRGVEDVHAIEQSGLPVYASIPMSPYQRDHESVSRQRMGNGKPYLLAIDAPNDLAIEALRSLRTSLHFATLEAKNNVLMICGASPGAGKTFVSTNLAVIVAQTGQRVLLIDGDMRRGMLHKVMGHDNTHGLSELLVGRAELSQAIHRWPSLEGVHFISRGPVPPNPSELLMHPNFKALMKTASEQYDLVIIDTPPILAVTDATIIGHEAGTSLLVARFGVNRLKELALARQRLLQNGIDLKGAIFNAVERRSDSYYAYGYEYASSKADA